MLKKILLFMFVGLITMTYIIPINAADLFNEKGNTVEYDLVKGGTQEFTIYDEDGELTNVVIKEVSSQTRAIDNGTYEIATSRAGSWKARFEITIKNYKIISGGYASASAITGSFISKNFKIDSSTMATYYLKRKIGLIISNMYLRAQIENKNLKVIVR